MAITLVQHKAAQSVTNGNTVTVTITSSGAGNLIVVATTHTISGATTTNVTDNKSGGSNTYTQLSGAAFDDGSSDTGDIWYCLSAGGGVTQVTATFSTTDTHEKEIYVFEVSGFTTAALDVSNHLSAQTNSATTDTGASVTTTTTSGFSVGVVTTNNSVTLNPKAGNEYTAGGDIQPASGNAACSLIYSTAAAHRPDWEDGSSNYGTATVAFKDTVAAPDTYDAPIQGTSALRAGQQSASARSQQLARLGWNPGTDLSGPLPTQVAPWTQPVQGTASLAAQQQAATVRALLSSALRWVTPEDVNGDVPIQIAPFVPPIPGVGLYTSTLQAFYGRAVVARALLQFEPSDFPVTPTVDTWTQAVQGTASLAALQRAWSARVSSTASLYWTEPEDTSALLSQPDSYTQPVSGPAVYQRGLWERSAVARIAATFGRTVPGDLSTPVNQPSTWTVPLIGAWGVDEAQYRVTERVVRTARYLWSAPQDVTAQPQQPDTYQPPIQGTGALAAGQAARQVALRAALDAVFNIPEDLSAPLPLQPDTWTQAVQGTFALAQAQRAQWLKTASTMPRLWQTPEDVSASPTQPDTWMPTVPGVGIYALNLGRVRAQTLVETRYLWNPARDQSGPLPIQPDTYQAPIAGTQSLRLREQDWRLRSRLTTRPPFASRFHSKWALHSNQIVGPIAPQPEEK